MKNIKEKNVLLSFFIAMMVPLSVYLFPLAKVISLAEISMIVMTIGIIFKHNKLYVYHDKMLFAFVCYSLVITIINGVCYNINMQDSIIRLLRDGFYYIIIYILGYSCLNYKIFVKWIKIIAIMLSILIIVQQIVFVTTGYLIPGFLLNASVSQSTSAIEIYQHTINATNRTGYLKANGFLLEAAHCSQALAIASILIYDKNEENKSTLYLIILLSIASVLTFSASAVIYVLFIWGYIVFNIVRRKKVSKPTLGIIALIIIIIIISVFFSSQVTSFSSVFDRVLEATDSNTLDGSVFTRIYKGFIFWHGLPTQNQIFGLGFGNYDQLNSLYSGIRSLNLANSYMNSFSYLLVSSGITGIILFAFFLVKLFLKSNEKGRVMEILLILMCISASPYSSASWVWMMLIIIYNRKKAIN